MTRVSEPSTRFTVDEYWRLAESGLLGEGRTELINGRVYIMSPQAEPHMTAMSNATEVFNAVKRPTDWVIYGGTMKLDRFSAPEPDVLWLPVAKRTPEHLWPDPILIVEISHTTYRKDSGVKLRKYAFHRVPDYWIANLKADRVEVYRDPQNPTPTGRERDCTYASVQYFTRGQSIAPLSRPEVSVGVDELLP